MEVVHYLICLAKSKIRLRDAGGRHAKNEKERKKEERRTEGGKRVFVSIQIYT